MDAHPPTPGELAYGETSALRRRVQLLEDRVQTLETFAHMLLREREQLRKQAPSG